MGRRLVSGRKLVWRFDGLRHIGRLGKTEACTIAPAHLTGLAATGYVLACGDKILRRDHGSVDEAKLAAARERFDRGDG